MSGYKGYKAEDNFKRKKNNTGDNHYDSTVNTNTKAWTTSGSALTKHLQDKAIEESKKAPVKTYTPEELEEYAKKHGLEVSKKVKKESDND